MQREDLKPRIKQIVNKTYWQTSPHLKYKLSSEEFEDCGALMVTIVTTNLKYIPTPGWSNLNMCIKGLAWAVGGGCLVEGKASCPFVGIKAIYLSLSCLPQMSIFNKNHETYKKARQNNMLPRDKEINITRLRYDTDVGTES